MRKNLIRHTLPLAVVGCGAVVATLALTPAQAAPDPEVITRTVTDTAQVDALRAKLDKVTAQRDRARAARDDVQASLDAQIDWSADVVTQRDDAVDEVAWLTDQLADAQQAARPETWNGFTVGEVIVCEDPLIVAEDRHDDDNLTWASCQ
jgi:hypothetical protein